VASSLDCKNNFELFCLFTTHYSLLTTY
jgi:hypothetical protein